MLTAITAATGLMFSRIIVRRQIIATTITGASKATRILIPANLERHLRPGTVNRRLQTTTVWEAAGAA